MMKNVLTVLLFVLSMQGFSQDRFYTKSGVISFESKAPMENIEAVNRSVTTVFDRSNGNLQFSVLIRGFEFRKALMQEHFNENYMESDKYPRAEFKGSINDYKGIDPGSNGTMNVIAKGTLLIHNVSREVLVKGVLTTLNGSITLKADFPVALEDHNIKVPSLVRDKIARTVMVNVDCNLIPLKN